MTPRWPLTPHLLRSHVWLYPRIILSKSHENMSKYVDTVTIFSKTWIKGHWPLDDLWPQVCLGHMYDSTQGSSYPSPMKICQSMWIQWPFSQKLEPKCHWPLDDLWPQVCWGQMCGSIQGSFCPSPMKIHQSMWIQWPFFKNLNPHLLRSHVRLYPRIIVSKSHGNTSMHVCGYSDQFYKIPHTCTTYYILLEWVITQSPSELSSGETINKVHNHQQFNKNIHFSFCLPWRLFLIFPVIKNKQTNKQKRKQKQTNK